MSTDARTQITRARNALIALNGQLDPKDPFAVSLTRALRSLGFDVDVQPLFGHWSTRSIGSPAGEMRYRWELTHRHLSDLAEADPSSWNAWRSSEAELLKRDPFQFEARLAMPIVISDAAELLTVEARRAGPDSQAQMLLDEAAPAMRRDFAGYVQAIHPWADTFALWCLTRRPFALARLHPLAVAIATCHAAEVEPGMNAVRGKRFPFHQQSLVSASAQLAVGLLALGLELEQVGRLATFVAAQRHPSGDWGDVEGESDVLTTLVSADLLSHVDPSFDLAPTVTYFASKQGEDGLWRALGPEAPWLTFEIIRWLKASVTPFDRRFRWPFLLDVNRDHKTQLPFYAYFVDVARLFETLPGLARTTTEMGFIDLAGFREFNNKFGQDRGDDVLREFADALGSLEGATAIRDGGDEFLIVGAPCRTGLFDDLEVFRKTWPRRFERAFGADVPPVAPRILTTHSPCGAIVRTREKLGREIGQLKVRAGALGPEGVLAKI